MGDLSETRPFEGQLPITVGSTLLEGVEAGALTVLTAFGESTGLAGALEAAHGLGWPGPNRATGKEGKRCLWFGLRDVMLVGPEPDEALADHAAVVDQSDGWAVVRLSGPGADDVLARLVPVDLRAAHFKRGHTVRTQVQHMSASITRVGQDGYLIMVFRSMAETLVHEVKSAMAAVASRR